MTNRTENGYYRLVEQLRVDGLTTIYGNPGTVEQGFLDAIEDFPDIRYILTLHENVAIMAADAHARAINGPVVAQIHSSPGLGNAIGALYQAWRGNSPLVVIGGDAGIRYQALEAQMYADLVAMAQPVTKWSTMVRHPGSLLRVMRRAIKVAATPPRGPVYVCLPQDILEQAAVEPVRKTLIPSTRVFPDAAAVDEMAGLLARAERPTVFMGDGIAAADAQAELLTVAEMLGADVWGVDSGELNIAYDHPLYRGQTGHMFGSSSLQAMRSGDVNLVVGTYLLPEVFPELGSIFADDAKVLHIDLDAGAIGKNHPVDIGIVADPKSTLAALASALCRRLGADRKDAAAARIKQLAAAGAKARADAIAADEARGDTVPMRFSRFARELAARLPDDVVLFEEALSASPDLFRYLPPRKVGHFFQVRGGSLGTALAGGLGLKGALPDKRVVAVSGDGAAMYTIQSFWTAARHNLDVLFIIANNLSYRLLQSNISQYWRENGIEGRRFPTSFDLSVPKLDFASLAHGLGMAGRRVETPADIGPALDEALAHKGPFVLDVVIEGDTRPDLVGIHCSGR